MIAEKVIDKVVRRKPNRPLTRIQTKKIGHLKGMKSLYKKEMNARCGVNFSNLKKAE